MPHEQLGPTPSDAVRLIASTFGELTVGSAARLHPERPDLDVYTLDLVHRRAGSLETLAQLEAYLLYDAAYNLPGSGQELEPVERIDAIRRSRQMALDFGRVSGLIVEGVHNESSVLLALQDEPERWLTHDPVERLFSFTEYGQSELQKAYAPGRGCPVIGMRVKLEDDTTDDLFLLYWEGLAPNIGHYLERPDQATQVKQKALEYISRSKNVSAGHR